METTHDPRVPDRIIILPWREALEKVGVLCSASRRYGWFSKPDFAAGNAFLALLFAECSVLEALNDHYLSSDVPWDTQTGFPSHPTLIADGLEYVKRFEPESQLAAVIGSFSEWRLYGRYEMNCAHGSDWKKLRRVPYELWLDHSLEACDDGGLVVVQRVSVESDDEKHIAHHYGERKPDAAIDGRLIVWECKNVFRTTPANNEEGSVHFRVISLYAAKNDLWDSETWSAELRELCRGMARAEREMKGGRQHK